MAEFLIELVTGILRTGPCIIPLPLRVAVTMPGLWWQLTYWTLFPARIVTKTLFWHWYKLEHVLLSPKRIELLASPFYLPQEARWFPVKDEVQVNHMQGDKRGLPPQAAAQEILQMYLENMQDRDASWRHYFEVPADVPVVPAAIISAEHMNARPPLSDVQPSRPLTPVVETGGVCEANLVFFNDDDSNRELSPSLSDAGTLDHEQLLPFRTDDARPDPAQPESGYAQADSDDDQLVQQNNAREIEMTCAIESHLEPCPMIIEVATEHPHDNNRAEEEITRSEDEQRVSEQVSPCRDSAPPALMPENLNVVEPDQHVLGLQRHLIGSPAVVDGVHTVEFQTLKDEVVKLRDTVKDLSAQLQTWQEQARLDQQSRQAQMSIETATFAERLSNVENGNQHAQTRCTQMEAALSTVRAANDWSTIIDSFRGNLIATHIKEEAQRLQEQVKLELQQEVQQSLLRQLPEQVLLRMREPSFFPAMQTIWREACAEDLEQRTQNLLEILQRATEQAIVDSHKVLIDEAAQKFGAEYKAKTIVYLDSVKTAVKEQMTKKLSSFQQNLKKGFLEHVMKTINQKKIEDQEAVNQQLNELTANFSSMQQQVSLMMSQFGLDALVPGPPSSCPTPAAAGWYATQQSTLQTVQTTNLQGPLQGQLAPLPAMAQQQLAQQQQMSPMHLSMARGAPGQYLQPPGHIYGQAPQHPPSSYAQHVSQGQQSQQHPQHQQPQQHQQSPPAVQMYAQGYGYTYPSSPLPYPDSFHHEASPVGLGDHDDNIGSLHYGGRRRSEKSTDSVGSSAFVTSLNLPEQQG
jgi:hypothetical protein